MVERLLSSTTHYVLSLLIASSLIIWFKPGFLIACFVIFTALFLTRRAEKALLRRWLPGRDPLAMIIVVLVSQLIVMGLFYVVFVDSLIFKPEVLSADSVAEIRIVGLSGIFSVLLSMLIYLGFNAYRWEQKFTQHMT